MMKIIFTLLLVCLVGTPVMAATCVKDGSVCIDDTPCKLIQGNNVCLTDIGSTCWTYEDTYTCIKPPDQLQCQTFIDLMPDCWQTNLTCIQTDPTTGDCLKHEQSWECKDWQLATPAYVIKLADTITYVKNEINQSSCSTGANCTMTNETCIEPAETRIISGVPVTKSCWRWDRSYSCTTTSSADCLAIESDSTCTLATSTCASLNTDGSCAAYNKSYNCSSGTITSGSGDCLGDSQPCTTQTVNLPKETYTDGCQETFDPTSETCTLTRDVEVDKDYLYKCTSSNAINYCDPLLSAGCWQHTAPVCINTDLNGTCLEWDNTYRCTDEQTPIPPNVVFEDFAYTITKDAINNQCLANESNQTCVQDEEVCIEPAETRNINGLDVTKTCWKWERSYTCGTYSSAQCADLQSDPYCTETSSSCVDVHPTTGICLVYDKQFTCTDPNSGGTQSQTTCQDKVTCINGFCFDSSSTPDQDFAKPIAWMELARQAGQYQDPATLELFRGTSNQCRVRTWGTCCEVKSAGDSTNAGQYGSSSFTSSISGQVGRNAVNFIGSTYVHDALFMSDLVPDSLLNFAYGGGMGGSIGGNSFTPSVSYYGMTVSYANGSFVFGFDPWSLALQVAIQVIQQVLMCTMNQDEGILALRRGANLCTYVGSYCSKKILGWCYERKQGYCCFNSKLSKIINTQGRAQLGRSFGSAQSPDCSGFSPTELASLDFSAIDLSEFIAEIQPKALDLTGTMAVVADNVQCKTENASYFGAANTACNKSSTPGVIYNTPVVAP